MILLCFSHSMFLSEDQLQPHCFVFIDTHHLTHCLQCMTTNEKAFNYNFGGGGGSAFKGNVLKIERCRALPWAT